MASNNWLERLKIAAYTRPRGMSSLNAEVHREDLKELLYQFERLEKLDFEEREKSRPEPLKRIEYRPAFNECGCCLGSGVVLRQESPDSINSVLGICLECNGIGRIRDNES